jgi:hypothetical protein
MQLLFYASRNDESENRLDAAIRSVAPRETVERFVTLEDFRERLRSIVEPNSIMVLAAVDREELLKLQAFRDMLTEIYIILVLPDREDDTIKLAHLLRPRFLSQTKDDFSDLSRIVAQMIRSPQGHPGTAGGRPPGISRSFP